MNMRNLAFRLIYMKLVFGVLAFMSIFGVMIYGAVKAGMDSPHNSKRASELAAQFAHTAFPNSTPAIIIGSLVVAILVSFGDTIFGSGRKGSSSLVLSDEEFLARMELDAREHPRRF